MATEAESTRVDGKSAVKKANARIDEVAAALRVMLEHGEALEWMAGTVRAYGLGDRARQACDDVREALEEALESKEAVRRAR